MRQFLPYSVMFPLFYGFKGGKGILVTAGVMVVLDPLVLCVILGTFIIVVLISKIVSLGSVGRQLYIRLQRWASGC